MCKKGGLKILEYIYHCKRNETTTMTKRKKSQAPTPEAKALSLFLMAYKTIKPIYKEQAKYINRSWDLVNLNKLSFKDYQEEVNDMLEALGGYEVVVEKTVKHYIHKTGEWKLKGEDQYCQDAKVVAERILKEKEGK